MVRNVRTGSFPSCLNTSFELFIIHHHHHHPFKRDYKYLEEGTGALKHHLFIESLPIFHKFSQKSHTRDEKDFSLKAVMVSVVCVGEDGPD